MGAVHFGGSWWELVLTVCSFFKQVEDLVIVLDESLRASASSIAQKLRRVGRRVDLVLEAKKMKWVFKVCGILVCHLIY